MKSKSIAITTGTLFLGFLLIFVVSPLFKVNTIQEGACYTDNKGLSVIEIHSCKEDYCLVIGHNPVLFSSVVVETLKATLEELMPTLSVVECPEDQEPGDLEE